MSACGALSATAINIYSLTRSFAHEAQEEGPRNARLFSGT